jgi:hypothetical protein
MYDGTFDQVYYASGTGLTGNFWACGASGANAPNLRYVAMSAFPASGDLVAPSVIAINPLTSAAATCSPVTEIYGSGGTTDDYIFLSVTANGNQAVSGNQTCPVGGACLYNFTVSTNGTSTTVPSAATAGIATAGGATGAIIDNISSATGASQIYYSSLASETCAGNASAGSGGASGCAVQASQTVP